MAKRKVVMLSSTQHPSEFPSAKGWTPFYNGVTKGLLMRGVPFVRVTTVMPAPTHIASILHLAVVLPVSVH